jgi:hypothetical protein
MKELSPEVLKKMKELATFSDMLRIEFNKLRNACAQQGSPLPRHLEWVLQHYDVDLVYLKSLLENPREAGT